MAMKYSKPVVALLALIQLGTALAIIGITGVHMANVNVRQISSILNQTQCLLTDSKDPAICLYTYAIGAVSIIFSFAIGLLQICTCQKCGCGATMDSVFSLMAAAWVVVGGFIVATHAQKANRADLPQRDWRLAVVWLIWALAIAFGALFLVHLLRAISKSCSRCWGRRRGGAGGGGGLGDVEKGPARPPARALQLGAEVKGRAYMAGRDGGGGGAAALQQNFRSGASNI